MSRGRNLYPRTEDDGYVLGYREEIRRSEEKLEDIAKRVARGSSCRCSSFIEALILANSLNERLEKMYSTAHPEKFRSQCWWDWGYYVAVKNSIGWKVIFEIPSEKEEYRGFEIEKREVKTPGFETELIDEKTGVYNWDAIMKMNDEAMLFRRIAEGACEESYDHFIKKLGYDKFEEPEPEDDVKDDMTVAPFRRMGKESVFIGHKGQAPAHISYVNDPRNKDVGYHITTEVPKLKLGKRMPIRDDVDEEREDFGED